METFVNLRMAKKMEMESFTNENTESTEKIRKQLCDLCELCGEFF